MAAASVGAKREVRTLRIYNERTDPTIVLLSVGRMSRLRNTFNLASKTLHRSKMPAFTLYGARGSTNTDRVRLTLAEGGFTDYELVFLNLQKGEQKVCG